MQKAVDVYQEVFGQAAHTHGAAGWQMNRHAFALEQEFGFRYASDTRGSAPFVPVVDGREVTCVQLPTTLPTLDELIGCDDWNNDNVDQRVLADSRDARPHGHVYTLHAELEGMKLLPVMERLLQGWRAEGRRLGTMAELYADLDLTALPRHHVVNGEIEGRSGTLALQGDELLAAHTP